MIDVLVVDDSAFSRKIITNILEAIPGVRVLEAVRDGQEAIQKTVLLKPDLITLDLEMPRMNGFTFLRWLMTYQPTPVIVVSAQEADESVFKALDLGALDFVVKPTRHASLQLQEIEADLIEKVLAVPMLAKAKLRQTTQH
ncbi:MAG TPA: response regulator, partial [Acidobacteriota bacterium]|nr:response regulator [Acidobacteriota bacterium]